MQLNNTNAAAKNATSREEAYRLAKQLRTANRELERQLNIKKSKRTR